MRCTCRRMVPLFVLVAVVAVALALPPAITAQAPEVKIEKQRLTDEHVRMLATADGHDLYQVLCSSCHAMNGKGVGAISEALHTPIPDLTLLSRSGVQRSHVIYVLTSTCDDPHHHTAAGLESMPCWNELFRSVMHSDRAALLIATRLADHVDALQEEGAG